MSSEAVGWAFKQICPSSSIKFTLVALCECANYKTGRIFPSIAHIEEITGQNRKTIISNIAELERLGFISDTGERAGTTKQIKVYEAMLGMVPNMERSQKRNSTENVSKQSQKRDTEPSITFLPSETKVSSGNSPSDDEPISEKENIDAWNILATNHGLPKVAKLTADRKRKLAVMRKQSTIEELQAALGAISRCKWMHGDNDRGWRADFDFFLQPKSFTKLIEGSYDQK